MLYTKYIDLLEGFGKFINKHDFNVNQIKKSILDKIKENYRLNALPREIVFSDIQKNSCDEKEDNNELEEDNNKLEEDNSKNKSDKLIDSEPVINNKLDKIINSEPIINNGLHESIFYELLKDANIVLEKQ